MRSNLKGGMGSSIKVYDSVSLDSSNKINRQDPDTPSVPLSLGDQLSVCHWVVGLIRTGWGPETDG